MSLKHSNTLKEITQAKDQECVVNSVISDVDNPKNSKENESVARVSSKKTVRKKLRDRHYDVGVNGHMEEKDVINMVMFLSTKRATQS